MGPAAAVAASHGSDPRGLQRPSERHCRLMIDDCRLNRSRDRSRGAVQSSIVNHQSAIAWPRALSASDGFSREAPLLPHGSDPATMGPTMRLPPAHEGERERFLATTPYDPRALLFDEVVEIDAAARRVRGRL